MPIKTTMYTHQIGRHFKIWHYQVFVDGMKQLEYPYISARHKSLSNCLDKLCYI